MSDIIQENDDLSTTQEYIIAGIVILLFGLLYLMFNYGVPQFTFSAQETPGAALSTNNTTPPLLQNLNNSATTQRMPLSQNQHNTATKATDTQTGKTRIETLPTSNNAATASVTDTDTSGGSEAEITGQAQNTSVNASNENTTGVQTNNVTQNPEQNTGYVITDQAVLQLRDYLLNGTMEKPILMETVTFTDKATAPEATSDIQIKDLAMLMQQHPDNKILIRGHSANEGSAEESKQLSLMRANAMGKKLVAAGGIANNIIIMGMGSTEPLSANTTRRGREKNRRVDIAITQ